jgi:hypothetical protein
MTAFVISNAGGAFNAAASYVANSGTPIAGDTITATGTSGNLTVTATAACASIDFTNYVGTFTINSSQVITITSTFKMVAGMSVGGTGTLSHTGTATLTSAGKQPAWILIFGGAAVTKTLADDWTTTGNVQVASTPTINSNTIHAKGGFNVTSGTAAGTTAISIEGGTWAGAGVCNMNVSIAGSVTVSSNVQWGTGSLTYSSGSLTSTSSTLTLNGSCTISLGASARLNNVTVAAAITLTLGANLFVDGTFTFPNTALTITGAFTLTMKTVVCTTITATRLWTINIATTIVISGSITLAGIVGGKPKFQSSSGGTQAIITLNNSGFLQSIYLVDATDIDSSQGQKVYSLAGALGGNTVNWTTTLTLPTAYPRPRAVNVGGSI